jgi:cysteine desulfurase
MAGKLKKVLPVVNRSYFDHNATTPVAPEVLGVYTDALRDVYGNASSIHQTGQEARKRLEAARQQVASVLGADTREIVFCSGGTEANNTVVQGAVRGRERAHVITTAIEHPAVLQPCAAAGVDVTYVPAGQDGVVDPADVRRALRPETVLISVMHVNNEIGTVQPVAEIAHIAREAGVLMHSDGVQAAGRIPVDVRGLGVDLYTVSGHKMYAPKGIGALYVRNGTPARPLLFGGRHENGWRAGTENVPGAVALGAAAALAAGRLESDALRIAELRRRLERGIVERVPDVRINGAGVERAPGTTSICFEAIEGEAVVIALDLNGFCVSSGAACSSGAVEPSHVLTAIGLSKREAKSCIRFSLGRSNTAEQVDALIDAVAQVASRLRKISTDYATHA